LLLRLLLLLLLLRLLLLLLRLLLPLPLLQIQMPLLLLQTRRWRWRWRSRHARTAQPHTLRQHTHVLLCDGRARRQRRHGSARGRPRYLSTRLTQRVEALAAALDEVVVRNHAWRENGLRLSVVLVFVRSLSWQ